MFRFPLLLHPATCQNLFFRVNLQPQESSIRESGNEGDRNYQACMNGCRSVQITAMPVPLGDALQCLCICWCGLRYFECGNHFSNRSIVSAGTNLSVNSVKPTIVLVCLWNFIFINHIHVYKIHICHAQCCNSGFNKECCIVCLGALL